MVVRNNPNEALRSVLQRFFDGEPQLASLRYHIASQAIILPLRPIVRAGFGNEPPALPNEDDLRAIADSEKNDWAFVEEIAAKYPWQSSRTAAEFIALLCTDLSDIDARLRAGVFTSPVLGGLPTMAQVRMEPSASLSAALSKAIALQQGGDAGRTITGRTLPTSSTCLIVSLTDCAMVKAEEQYNSAVQLFTSYGHCFALLIDATGVGVYQAWGNGPRRGGYSLQEGLDRAPKPMSYKAAAAFAATFEQLCGRLTWDEDTNKLYDRLFGVDMRALEVTLGLPPPPPRILSWIRILEIPGVTAERIRHNARFFT